LWLKILRPAGASLSLRGEGPHQLPGDDPRSSKLLIENHKAPHRSDAPAVWSAYRTAPNETKTSRMPDRPTVTSSDPGFAGGSASRVSGLGPANPDPPRSCLRDRHRKRPGHLSLRPSSGGPVPRQPLGSSRRPRSGPDFREASFARSSSFLSSLLRLSSTSAAGDCPPTPMKAADAQFSALMKNAPGNYPVRPSCWAFLVTQRWRPTARGYRTLHWDHADRSCPRARSDRWGRRRYGPSGRECRRSRRGRHARLVLRQRGRLQAARAMSSPISIELSLQGCR
jgi:hypothetical protein